MVEVCHAGKGLRGREGGVEGWASYQAISSPTIAHNSPLNYSGIKSVDILIQGR